MSKNKKRRQLKLARRKAERNRSKKIIPELTGTIAITPSGFGFVTPDDDSSQDIFIPPRFIGGAMHGDTVSIAMLPLRREDIAEGRKEAGRVVEIVKRAKTALVGEVITGHRIRPLNRKYPEDIKIAGSLCGAKRGDWVKVELIQAENRPGDARRGAIRENIGKAGEIKGDLDAVCSEYDLPDPYSAAENEEAITLLPADIKREDLRELFCVTIDPEDAKDFDDAISLAPGKEENEVEVGVHIADVAAWIRPSSKWDIEARRRSFTAYLPGRTLPMLPKSLTKNISLTEGVDSLAHTVILTVHKNSGRIIKSRRCHSTVKITKRLTFNQVQDFIDTGKAEDWDAGFAEKIRALVDLTRAMREHRRKTEKFLEMATTEIRVLCDDETNVISGLVRKVQREADQLVEDCMLAANTEVAKELIERKIPGMFRVHPEPEQEKVFEFSEFVASAFGFYPGDLTSRTACNEFLKSLPDDPRKQIILGAFLRSLPRAFYQEKPELHFGLGKERYSHFTSPIRRYPDLVVHQQLWADEKNERLRSNKKIEKLAVDCSEKENTVDEAYFTANDRLKLRYLQEQLDGGGDNLHEGMIAKVFAAGLLVDIQDLGIYGFVPIEKLRGRFRYDREENRMSDYYLQKSYKVGDYVYLQLSAIDFIKGNAIFQPVR